MAIKFNWEILSSSIAPSEDGLIKVIKSVKAKLYGCDENGFNSFFITQIDFESPNPSSYTPWDSVSEDVVIGWIESILDPRTVNAIEEQIISDINNSIFMNKIENYPLPWQ